MLETLFTLNHWKIDILTVALLLQGATFIAIPEELIILTLGFLSAISKVSFIEALISVQLGLLSANLAMMGMGRIFGSQLLKRSWTRWLIDKEKLDSALQMIQKYKYWVVFVTRFTPFIRGPVYLAAGLAKLDWKTFFLADAAASFIQIPIVLTLGGLVGKNQNALHCAYVILALIALGIIVFGISFRSKKKDEFSSAT